MITGKYPSLRLRRTRKQLWSRRLIQENTLTANDFILPVFLIDGSNKKETISDIITRISNENIRYKDTIDVDLAKFGALGNDIYNPYLMQGDVVFIPFKEKSISIYGGINIPGNYEFVENENLRELIDLAGGLRKSSDPSKIEITRFNTAKEKNTFSIYGLIVLIGYYQSHFLLLYPHFGGNFIVSPVSLVRVPLG